MSREQRAGGDGRKTLITTTQSDAKRLFPSITKGQLTPVTEARTTVHTTPSFLWWHQFRFEQR